MPPHPDSLHGLRPADIEWLATRAADWMGRALQWADIGDKDAAYAWARDAAHYAIVVLEARRLATRQPQDAP